MTDKTVRAAENELHRTVVRRLHRHLDILWGLSVATLILMMIALVLNVANALAL